MFSLSKGEPPTPPNPASDLASSIPNPPAPMEPDSGYEASPCCISLPDSSYFPFDENSGARDNVFESEDEVSERVDEMEWCPDCGDDYLSCCCSRTDSSATTVRNAGSSFTNPNTCDSDSSSSNIPSPPPSSRYMPVPCRHNHNDRLPCPCCSEDESAEAPSSSMSYLQNIVTSRSFPGSYPAAFLNWWTSRSSSSSPRVDAAQSRSSNRSADRRNRRSRRRIIDSDAPSSSSCEENSSDELFAFDEATAFEEVFYLDNLGTMTESEDLRVTSPEQLPDLVPLSSESSSRRVRSQSVSIPLDHEYLREIGISLRRFSNEFENRLVERNNQSRRSSLTSFLTVDW